MTPVGTCAEPGFWHLDPNLDPNPRGVVIRRVLDRAGYIRFRRWRVSAERGLSGTPVVAVWRYAEHLTLVERMRHWPSVG
jgi:hypothetical protein